MTRWHKPDCSAPNIVVDTTENTPSCLTCNATPDIDEIIRQQAHESSFPAPPPDKPRGEMNLWWPPSVPYLASEPSANSDANTKHSDPFPASASTPSTPNPVHQSPIYPTPLRQGELRLACLTAPSPPSIGTTTGSPMTKEDYPIHLTLETYPLLNCPSYETVSYCWTGEDGDSTRRHPVYAGEYWDVMLHTRNCWELLQFVRPSRGLRLVWVDAVCIDQGCDEEKAAQVAQMGRIYNMCSQVVVYLGPDVAPLLPEGRYPRRARLQDFGTMVVPELGGVRGVQELLQRRYFSRLWVIQELILSPRVVIRVGDVDFQSDGSTSGNLWKSDLGSLAPWVQHTSKGGPLDLDLLDVMRLTFSSACADPRDQLFGVMGIIADESWVLPPDYSLSHHEVFIGLFAYLITVRGMAKDLLKLASGVDGPPSIPSWVPDWASWDRWRGFFEGVDRFLACFYPADGLWVRADREIPAYYSAYILPEDCFLEGGAHVKEAAFHVCPTTGGLGANMIRLLTFSSSPELVGEAMENEFTLFAAQCGSHTVYILASAQRLDMLVAPGSDHLYVFSVQGRHARPGFCILRTVHGTDGNTKRLVATCIDVYFSLSPPNECSEPLDNDKQDGVLTMFGKNYPVPSFEPRARLFDHRGYIHVAVGDLYWTLDHVIEKVQQWLDTSLGLEGEDLFFPPKFKSKRRDILPFYLALLQAQDDYGVFLDEYERFVKEECGAKSRPNLWTFTVPYDTFEALRQKYEHSGASSWVKWKGPARDPGTGQTRGQPATGRISVSYSDVSSLLVKLHDSPLAVMARAAVRKTGESLEQLLSRNLTEEESLVKVPTCARAQKLIEDGAADGPVEHVIII